MARNRGGDSPADDEVTGLAGWLYTDLLLGLFVVFLGAVGFAVLKTEPDELVGPAPTTTSTSSTTSTTTTTVFEECTILKPFDDKLKNRIQLNSTASLADLTEQLAVGLKAVRDAYGVPAEGSRVAFALAFAVDFGGRSGEVRAEDFFDGLRRLDPPSLGDTVLRPLKNDSLRSNTFIIDVFLETGSCD